MKILITGASGFIGKEIVKECLSSGFEVRQINSHRNKKTDSENKLINSEEIFSVDITDYQNLQDLEKLRSIDVIIHSAGLAHQFGDTKKEDFELVNVEGARNLCELASKLKVKQFILISSTAVYGAAGGEDFGIQDEKQDDFSENSLTSPKTPYAESKLKAEQICTKICEANKIPLTIFRLAPVIGEENVGNVARLISAIDRKKFVWIGAGENFKSLIYKNDVARACVMLCEEKKGDTEIFNLSSESIRMKDFVSEISKTLQVSIPRFRIPVIFTKFIFGFNTKTVRIKRIYKIQQTIEKWLAADVYSNEKIKEKYNFAPKFTVAEGVRKQVEWYILERNRHL